ncbi:TetR family transcriptional regulator [Bifidobacterium stellenboschense]|uniref:TetR family transcriptional regulator n=1 Tax=Bifidobacterium stellenboschense TaxID=762211 RepID=A0A087DN95_9BIFI|nr:TetR family transcriptional regulator [Bifidobacterium stellenboschense]
MRAAREICLEKGFSKITVSDIAGRVHMTRSLFYHYFPDKDAVADAVLDDVVEDILAKLSAWDAARETGNIGKALDDVVRLTRALIADESPFSARMIHEGNAELYIRFIDRIADRIADMFERTTVRDFEMRHGLPITNVHETFFTLIVGLISLLRSHPETPDTTVKSVIAQTLHLTGYIAAYPSAIPDATTAPGAESASDATAPTVAR